MDNTSLIYKVLSNNASEAEKIELYNWIERSETNRIEFNDIKLLWDYLKDGEDSNSGKQSYDGFSKIKELMQIKLNKRKRNKKAFIAMTMILIVVFAYLFIIKSGENRIHHGFFKFDNASLEYVINTLEEEFEIQMEVEKNEILACKITATFYGAYNAADIIQPIINDLNLQYIILSNGKYRLTGMGCSNIHP